MRLLEVPAVGELREITPKSLRNWLEEEGGLVDDTDLGDGLLDGEAYDGYHGKAAVLNLSKLHVLAVLGVEGVQAEGVEAEVYESKAS